MKSFLRRIQNYRQGNGSRMFFTVTIFIRKKMKFMSIQDVTKNDLVGVKRRLFWFFGFARLTLRKNKS